MTDRPRNTQLEERILAALAVSPDGLSSPELSRMLSVVFGAVQIACHNLMADRKIADVVGTLRYVLRRP